MDGEAGGYGGLYEAIVVGLGKPGPTTPLALQIPSVLGREILLDVPGCFPPGVSVTTPAVSSSVWVMFRQGNPRSPVWMGVANHG